MSAAARELSAQEVPQGHRWLGKALGERQVSPAFSAAAPSHQARVEKDQTPLFLWCQQCVRMREAVTSDRCRGSRQDIAAVRSAV